MTNPHIRCTDADRTEALERLVTAWTGGLIDLNEFDRRSERVVSATTFGDLQELTGDLPGIIVDVPKDPSIKKKYVGAALIVGIVGVSLIAGITLGSGTSNPTVGNITSNTSTGLPDPKSTDPYYEDGYYSIPCPDEFGANMYPVNSKGEISSDPVNVDCEEILESNPPPKVLP